MLLQKNINIDRKKIGEFCRKNGIRRLSLFGSVLRDDFRPDSDVDVLVEFEPGRTLGYEFFQMEIDLAQIFGRPVDFVTIDFVSPFIRDKVRSQAETVYAPTDALRLRHMLEFSEQARRFVVKWNRQAVEEDEFLSLALERLVQLVGEAASGISTETRSRYPEIPWGPIVGARNRIVHAYATVSLDVL